MPNPVIVGVDTTDHAQDAIMLGRTLASALAAELVVAHVFPYDERRSRFASDGFEALLREDAERSLEALAGPAGPDARMITVADPSPARGLHRLAEREEAQMLVVASSHHGVVGRVVLGDVARQTQHAAPCAVAVAPLGYGSSRRGGLARIGVGYDGKPESRAALALAGTLAQALDAELRILGSSYLEPIIGSAGWVAYDVTPMQEAQAGHLHDVVDTAVAAQVAVCHGEVTGEQPGLALVRLSKEVDLLVVGSRAFGPAGRLLAGTTSDWVARRAACPVLVLPRTADVPAAV